MYARLLAIKALAHGTLLANANVARMFNTDDNQIVILQSAFART